jgi:3',5'-cyclic AMP phosphodiesterase CpdA
MDETFTLAHLSDLHLSSLNDVKVGELLNKRIYGYLKWQLRRRSEHHRKVLDALLHNLKSTTPDHIAVTGDLTHLGLPREFREARNVLQSLGPPSRVTVIPGNHDTYVSTDWNSTFALWTDYMLSDEAYLGARAGTDGHTTFPSLRLRGIAALIGVSTARPSAPLLAVGSVGEVQLQQMEKILVETGKQRLFRVMLIHHPPLDGTVSWRKRLTDAAALRSVLDQHGVELILHGHAHRSSLRQLETTVGAVPAIGVPSASALGRTSSRRARYHLYRFKANRGGWEMVVTVMCYSPTQQEFTEESEKHLELTRSIA